MLSKPKNYEEAKIILKNSVGDELRTHNKKVNLIRAGIINTLVVGALVALGVKFNDITVPLAGLPFLGAAGFASFIPIITTHKTDKTLADGSYFKDKSEQQVIDIASRYVDEYNEYERRSGGKGR